MSRMFRFIQNDDVVKSFRELKDTVLRERPVVIARQGNFSLLLRYLSDNELGLSVENSARHMVMQERTYDIDNTPAELVSRGVRHACQKMSELSDEDVNRKRLQIWKWYIMDFQQNNAKDAKEFMEKALSWSDDYSGSEREVLDLESYLHGDYQNMGHTIELIERFLADDPVHCEIFRKFAVEDIMEMTSEDTKDRVLAEAEAQRAKEGHKKHTYRFTVSVEATDKEHARQALLNYLAGDERISIQK